MHPHSSVVIRSRPKGGLSACVRIDQRCETKNPDSLSQIRINLVEVTGFEPATFWSRTKRATKLRYTSTWSQWGDSNPRPTVYETVALPAELHWHGTILCPIIIAGSPAGVNHPFPFSRRKCAPSMGGAWEASEKKGGGRARSAPWWRSRRGSNPRPTV